MYSVITLSSPVCDNFQGDCEWGKCTVLEYVFIGGDLGRCCLFFIYLFFYY